MSTLNNFDNGEKQIVIIAQVFDKGTTKTVTIKSAYQPKVAGFDIMPIRPMFDDSTETLRVYVSVGLHYGTVGRVAER